MAIFIDRAFRLCLAVSFLFVTLVSLQAKAAPPSDFVSLRANATAEAARWNAAAKLFRADVWGQYSRSRLKPAGARFLYFVPGGHGDSLEVRVNGKGVRSFPYPAKFDKPPVELPANVLTAEQALWRLWDLAPSVPAKQIYLQLLTPGVEAYRRVTEDSDPTSRPIHSFLNAFPVQRIMDETGAPEGRVAWRMLAIRDRTMPVDKAFATQIYIDAVSGDRLSPRDPAVGAQLYYLLKLTPASPVNEFLFPKGEIPLDTPAEKVGSFDTLAVAVKAESIFRGLRLTVRDGQSTDELWAAVDKMCTWWQAVEKVRATDAATGTTVLEFAARRDPTDLRVRATLLRRYADALERERRQALASPTIVGDPAHPLGTWFVNEFELNGIGTDNPDQVLIKLNPSTGAWEFRGKPTGVATKTYRAAVNLVRSVHAGKPRDLDFERQVTRINLLAFGNRSALTTPETGLDPADPVALMLVAEDARVDGVNNLVNAQALRTPSYSSSTFDKPVNGGFIRETSSSVRYPTPEELAAAKRMEDAAQQGKLQVAGVEDLALKIDALDWRPYYQWGRIEARFYNAQIAGRVITRGLLVDPGCAELHACRSLAFTSIDAVADAEMSISWTLARPYTIDDLSPSAAKTPFDPMTAYLIALQRMRLNPEHLGARLDMLKAYDALEDIRINGEEVMPDAREQHQREAAVIAVMAQRLSERTKDEWPTRLDRGVPATREQLDKLQAGALVMRGQDLQTLGRPGEAKVCFERALVLDPDNTAARKGVR